MSRRPNIEARDKIMQTAQELILKNGFKGVSMDEIATAVGMKKANLFHYFPTKEALGLAVFDYATQCEGATYDQQDPLDGVREMFEGAAERMREGGCCGGCFVGNMAQELSDYNERMRLRVAEHLKSWVGRLAGYLEDHRSKGTFRPEFASQEAARSLVSLFEGAMLMAKASRSIQPLEDAKQMALSYLRTYKR